MAAEGMTARRINDSTNPFEFWRLENATFYGLGYYTYTTNPYTEDISKYGSKGMPARAQVCHAVEDEDESMVTLTKWSLLDQHLPMSQDSLQDILLHVLASGTKSVKRELNGCI